MIIPINDTTVAIETAADLSDVVTLNSSITYIYFAENIELTSGITINPARTLLILDGEYPAGTRHTFTDMNSDTTGNTLGIRAASNIQITLKNMDISGRNWYGVPYIYDSNATRGLTITYENLNYTGRQMTFNRHGTTRYINCNITIVDISIFWPGEEVGEVANVEIGGITTITKSNRNDSAFYFCGDIGYNSFKILANADVTVTLGFFFMFLENTSEAVPFTIETGASFRLSTDTGFSFNNDHRASNFVLEENASFEYHQSSVGVGAALSMTGTLTVNQNARFFMRADYTGNMPVIRFRTAGTAQNLNLLNPKSFVVYKMNTAALVFDSERPFYIFGGQVNYWQTAMTFPTAGTFDDPPLYPWHNPNWSNFQITGSVAAAMYNVTTTLSDPENPPISNLQLQNARVLSVGNLPLSIDPVVNDHRPVSGRTDPFANIKVEYTEDGISQTLLGTADAVGFYSITTPEPLTAGTKVTVSCNVPFLYRTEEVTVREQGELFIQSAPIRITFTTPPISRSPLILGRQLNQFVTVMDERVDNLQWELMAAIDGPMVSASGHMLYDCVVFVPNPEDYANMVVLTTDTPTHVYTGGPGVVETNIIWDNDAGILFNPTAPIHLGEIYTANVIWTVQPIDTNFL